MVKAILFDFDGVLTTLKTGSYASSLYFSEKLGLDADEICNKRKLFMTKINAGNLAGKDVWRDVLSEYGKTLDEEMLYKSYLFTPLDEKMFAYACELKNEYMVGILTDDDAGRFDALMKKHNLQEKFTPIIRSSEEKCTKRGLEIFKRAAERCGLMPAEIIFIDNTLTNIKQANLAGFHGIYFDDKKRDHEMLRNEIMRISQPKG